MKNQVMVVDDDLSILETVDIVLRSSGYIVAIAKSGHECLAKLRKGYKGLILMDIMMPEMDGWATINAIVNENLLEGCAICMLTAINDPGPEMENLKECVMDYIRKPFTPEELIESVEEFIQYAQ